MNHDRKKQEKKHKIFAYIIISLICCMILLAFIGCKTQQTPVVTNTDITERTEQDVLRDTIIKEKPDSATITALFKCDSLNNVLLDEINTIQGDRIKPSINITHNDDGSINVDFNCKEDSLEHEIQIRDKIIKELRSKKEQVPVYIEKEQSKFLVNSGIALWVIIALLIVAVIVGIILKIKK